MNEFGNTAMGFSAFLACVIAALITGFTSLADDRGGLFRVRHPRRLALGIILTLTGWIWGPWAGFSIWWTYEKSTSGINYLQRPAEVIPENRQTIDLNKPEHK